MTADKDIGDIVLYSSYASLLREAVKYPSKNKVIKRTRKRSKPNQTAIYGESIHKLKKEGYTNREIGRILNLKGVSSIYFRYKTQLNNS